MNYNQQELSDACSFLSIPVDVRVQIYKLVLGGRTLHFNDYFKELGNRGIFQCTASWPDVALFVNGEHTKVAQFVGSEVDNCLRCRHLGCYADWGGLQVSLLQVCKAMYYEASLVPFAENTFTFPSREMVSRFVARLEPWQAAAVHQVILYQQDWWRYWERNSIFSRYYLRWPPFSNLRKVTIIVEYVVDRDDSFACGYGRPDLLNSKLQDDIVAAMGDLISGKLERVEVAIVAIVSREGGEAYLEANVERLEAWASRIRAVMQVKKSPR